MLCKLEDPLEKLALSLGSFQISLVIPKIASHLWENEVINNK